MDQEFREIHAAWLQCKGEEEQGSATSAENLPAEVETPISSAPRDLPSIDIGVPHPVLQDIEYLSVLYDVGFSSSAFTDDRTTTIPSPTLSVSTVSDLTPTELGDDFGEDNGERIPFRHETFYIEDGNVEIVCGHTLFRVHSSVVSFSSPSLRDALSQFTLLKAPTLQGCPRVIFKDSAEDFAVLLKTIYTPGYVPPPLGIGPVD